MYMLLKYGKNFGASDIVAKFALLPSADKIKEKINSTDVDIESLLRGKLTGYYLLSQCKDE